MHVPPTGRKGIVVSIRTGAEYDARVGGLKCMDVDGKIDYLKRVVATHAGGAHNFADLGKLALGWTSELFGLRPEYKFIFALALRTKEGAYSLVASNYEIDLASLGLDKPNGLLEYAAREKTPVYLPNVLQKNGGDFSVVRLIKNKAEVVPLSKTGIDIKLLAEKQGSATPCFLAIPLVFKDEPLGALFVAIGAADFISSGQSDELIIARTLGSNLAFGISVLQAKNTQV